MKKLILPLLLLVAFTMLVAVESAPSAVVGYFKKNIADAAWQAMSLPFAYPSLDLATTMGDQFAENDALIDLNTGSSTSYYAGYGWDGALTDLQYGGAYNLNRAFGNGALQYYLLGKVDPQAFTKTFAGNGGWTAFGMNEAAPVTIQEQELFFGANSTENDAIIDFNTGSSATYYAGYGWDGALPELAPTDAYNYNVVAGAPGFTWTYTPTRGNTQTPVMSNRNSK